MSKDLNETAMRNELQGSAFFSSGQPAAKPSEPFAKEPTVRETTSEPMVSSKPDTMTPRHHGAMTLHSPHDDQVIETIRRAVHQLGKEDATYRFTEAEKKALADAVYTYGTSGIKTSQNEITRIAINLLMEDYRANDTNSVLARVLERLNA